MEAGADPLALDLDGWTPAHAAAHGGRAPTLAVLLQRAGGSLALHMRDAAGMTPLHLATSLLGHPKDLAGIPHAVDHCLQGGADVTCTDAYGMSARDYAQSRLSAVSSARQYQLANGSSLWIHDIKRGDIAFVTEKHHRFALDVRGRVVRMVRWHARRHALAAFARARPAVGRSDDRGDDGAGGAAAAESK